MPASPRWWAMLSQIKRWSSPYGHGKGGDVVCFTLRFDDDVDIDVPCGQHQLMPDPNRCISYEPPQPKRECPLSGLPCSTVGLWH